MSSASIKARIEKELLSSLNQVQREAVLHGGGPLLIIAGAGSGKTRVITHRIAHLCRVRDVPPYAMLAVTFTNKAAQEMRERLENIMGPMARESFVRTFHSLGMHILSRNSEKAGLKASFSVYDSQAQLGLLKKILKDKKINSDYLRPQTAAEALNRARDNLQSPVDYKNDSFYAEEISIIYKEYMKRLRENNAVDFGDLLYESVRLLRKYPDVLAYYANRWRYCMIDEYQDTNYVQYVLGRMLSEERRNIVVVGDDDQAIYSWRGANVGNILNFEKDYPECLTLRLEDNYRSYSPILKAASSLIANNRNRLEKTLQPKREGGEKVVYERFDTDNEEALAAVRRISSLRRQGIEANEISIFYRTNAQSRIFEQALQEAGMLYVLVGSYRFYERKEIKDILAYLAVIANVDDSISLERIINVPPRGIGETSLKRLHAHAFEKGISLYQSMHDLRDTTGFRSASRLGSLFDLFERWRALEGDGLSLAEVVRTVLSESGYMHQLEKAGDPESASRIDNLGQLLDGAADYEEGHASTEERSKDKSIPSDSIEADAAASGLAGYMQQISLYTSASEVSGGKDAVQLMTLHNAKGLEFRVVILTGLEEGYLPHGLSVEEQSGIEEERRLLYVGITRAKDHAYLSSVEYRRIFGSYQPRLPSRFIDEIDANCLYTANGPRAPRQKTAKARETHKTRETYQRHTFHSYKSGDRIKHERYGTGTVLLTEETVAGTKLKIRFDDPEDMEKTFLDRYAPIEPIH